MKPKIVEIDGKQYAEMSNGAPVYVTDEGRETSVDVDELSRKLTTFRDEAQEAFKSRDKAKESLRAFEGIDDPAAARKALQTVANLSDKQVLDAAEIDRIKTDAVEAIEQKYAPIVTERDTLKSQLHKVSVSGAFASSAFVSDKLAIPADLVESRFGSHFAVQEDGSVLATFGNGDKIYSKENPGELASFDEALAILVDQYPAKEHIMKASLASGSGRSSGPNIGKQSGASPNMLGTKDERTAAVAARFPDLPVR